MNANGMEALNEMQKAGAVAHFFCRQVSISPNHLIRVASGHLRPSTSLLHPTVKTL